MCSVVPDDNHLSRYCKPSAMGQDGLPMAVAFTLRHGEDHLSVNWLERLGEPDLEAAVDHVRAVFRAKGYRVKPSGGFAVLNVAAVKAAVLRIVNRPARVEHLPLDNDESHSGVFGYTADDLAVAMAIKALVSLEDVFPGVTDHPPPTPET